MGKTYKLGAEAYKKKSFPTVPGGKYQLQVTSKTQLVKGAIKIHAKVLKNGKGEKVKKNVTLFDHIAFHVDWKVAQLLMALGKKLKEFTPEHIAKLVKGKTIWAILREEEYNEKMQNKVVQYLPPKDVEEDDDDVDDDEEDEDEDSDGDDDDESDDDEEEDGDDDDDSDDDDDDESDDDDDDDSDDDDEEEEEEEEEEEDKPKLKKGKTAGRKRGKK